MNINQVGIFTVAVRDELFKNGDAMVNYAEIDGRICMRLVTVNFDLNTKHIDQLFSDIESNAYKLLTNYI
jgi:hypothetical protein